MALDKILRVKDVAKQTGYATSTINNLVTQGKLPRPFKILDGQRATGWFEEDIEKYFPKKKQKAEA